MHGFAILVAPLIPISFVSGLLGSFFLAAYGTCQFSFFLPAPLHPLLFVSVGNMVFWLNKWVVEEKGRNVAVGFQTKSDEMTHFILSFVGAIAGQSFLPNI